MGFYSKNKYSGQTMTWNYTGCIAFIGCNDSNETIWSVLVGGGG